MPQHVRGDVEVLVWGQMGVGLLGNALQDEEGLRPVQPLAAPGRKQGSRHVAPLIIWRFQEHSAENIWLEEMTDWHTYLLL